MRNTHTILVALAAATTLHVACGKRGDPLPPLRRTPQPVVELAVAQRGDQLEVRLQTPRATTEGERLGVVTVELSRALGTGDFQKIATRRQLKAAPGERLVVSEALPAVGTLVRVAAVATSNKRSSVLSSVRSLTVVEAVPAPSGLEAALEPDGVRLHFAPPDPLPPWIQPSPEPSPHPSPSSHPEPGGPQAAQPTPTPTPEATPSPEPTPTTGGVFLYRRLEESEYATPLVAEPLRGETSFLDTTGALGARVCYVARTVVSGQPLVESAASNEACVSVEDKKPPAAPQGVAVLATDAGIEVSWSPSPEPDLAVYRVYRQAAGEAPERIAEVKAPETSALDTNATSGRLAYFVTAVDTAGNEGPPSASVEWGRR